MRFTKYIALALATASAFAFAGCSVRQTGSAATKSDATTTTIQTAVVGDEYTSYEVGETARNELVELSVDQVEVFSWDRYNTLGEWYDHHDYVKIHVSLTNLSVEDLNLSPDDLRCYIDNEELGHSTDSLAFEALGISGDTIVSATIHPGRTETGYMLYEFYRDWTTCEIQYEDTALSFWKDFSEDDVIETSSLISIPSAVESSEAEELSLLLPNETNEDGTASTMSGFDFTATTTQATEKKPAVTAGTTPTTTVVTTTTIEGGDEASVTTANTEETDIPIEDIGGGAEDF